MRPVIQINQFCIPNAPLPWGLPYWCDGCTEKIKDQRSKESVRIAGYIHASQNMKSNYNNTTTQQHNNNTRLVKQKTTTSATKHPHEKAMLPPLGCLGSGTEDCSPTWELG
jgi:hypothetical protein